MVHAARTPVELAAARALLTDGEHSDGDAWPGADGGEVYVLSDPADGPAATPVAVAVLAAGGVGAVVLHRIVVAPQVRGVGLDVRLLLTVADSLRAAGIRQVRATVTSEDDPLWALLRRAGLAPFAVPASDRTELGVDL